jgi:hypothetical protein
MKRDLSSKIPNQTRNLQRVKDEKPQILIRTNSATHDDKRSSAEKKKPRPIRSPGFAPFNTEKVKLSGEFWVCLTIHAKRAFADPESFRNFKGSGPYHDQILKAGANWNSAGSNFAIDEDAVKLREHGFYAGVFEQYPLLYEFVPVYRYKGEVDHILDQMALPAFARNQHERETASRESLDTLGTYFADHQVATFRGNTHHQNSHLFHLKYLTCKDSQKDLVKFLNAENGPDILDYFKGRDIAFHSRLATDFIAEWRKWKQKRLIMTRYGYFQVWLMQEFEDLSLDDTLRLGMCLNKLYFQRQDLADWLSDDPKANYGKILEPVYRNLGINPFPMTCHYSWEIARILISKYIADFNRTIGDFGPLKLVNDFQERWYKDDQSERIDSEKPDLPFRWQHRVFSLTEVQTEKGRRVPHSEVKKILSTLLEGVPIKLANGEGSHDFGAPEVSSECVASWTSKNLASWKNEMMLVSSDISVIYSPLATKTTCIFHQDIQYSDYWKTVLRGLAFLCEMRMLAFQLKTETARLLEDTLKTRRVTPELVQGNRKQSMLLARLRTASDATTLAAGEYASAKFERISEVFSIDKTIESTQKNLELSNAGLAQKESMILERSGRVLNFGAALFATLALALELPSYWLSSRDLRLGDPNQSGYYLYRPFIDIQAHSDSFVILHRLLTPVTTSLIVISVLLIVFNVILSTKNRVSDDLYFKKAEKLYHS